MTALEKAIGAITEQQNKIIQNHGYRNEMLPNGTHLCIPKEVQDFVLAWTETILNPWVMPKKKQKEIA